MKLEMDSIYENQVWNLVDPLEGITPIGYKWIFKKKTDMDDNVITYKICLDSPPLVYNVHRSTVHAHGILFGCYRVTYFKSEHVWDEKVKPQSYCQELQPNQKTQGMKKRKTINSFFKAKEETLTSQGNSSSNIDISNSSDQQSNKSPITDIDISSLEPDLGLRTPIWKYPVNQRDEIRRAYIKMGPYQPIKNEYPPTKFGSQNRRFQSHWFKKFTWLEYSPSKDAAFCFPCFLFDHKHPRNPAFTTDGFKYWKRVNDGDRCAFLMHIGCNTSPHNNAMEHLDNLMNIPHHIDKMMNAQFSEEKQKNRLRLTATIESIRWLTLQACAFRGHDESPSSNNRGNFIEMIKFMGKMNENIGDIVLEKAPKNAKYTSPDIQKDILNIFANQVRTKIRKEIGDAKFCILVDEARDTSNKEQMTIVLRFVDIDGFLRERFFAIVHVTDTTAATLKKKISDTLGCYDLHIHNMRGQGYDGASNMRGSWNGLQALFLKDCSCAYYVHCFAHRLQLALTAAAEKEVSIWLFFSKLNSICNLFNASPKRHAELLSAQKDEVAHMVAIGERDTSRGCNQIRNLLRPGKTRWSSNFDSICNMIDMYSSVITVLENMVYDGSSNSIRGEASGLLIAMKSFDFIFILHLMQKIMGLTNLLCRALQEKSLDILNAMDYVSTTKTLLQTLREEGFAILLTYVKEVCAKYDIEIPQMEARYKSATGRSCQQNDSITVEHHYQFDVFTAAIDFQVEELNSRFKDEAVELLKLSCALEPKENFKLFNIYTT
ncbi:zinc finger MYM-type protein 1-like [Zingiber officinale]|uniref:zinc finger MYM-type protein 1-like n=1 Tax=Zingiber officinale TaxID=94328 RepID=UPI001C4B2294|nr:zinc finger MYM-type protein 1-like [Zingiber officinale]